MSAAMLRVPTEIWLLVYEKFCPHCQSNQIPDFKDPEYEHGKSALVALSLTSRATRKLSQPILYHCFYHYRDQNTASKFLRTLISQPQLAKHVRMLSLPTGQVDIEHATRRDLESWQQAGVNIGLPTPGWVTQAQSGNGQSKYAVLDQESHLRYQNSHIVHGVHWVSTLLMFDLRLWQQLLIVGLVSNGLTHLAIYEFLGPITYAERSIEVFGPSQHPENPFHFPNLRVLSSPSFRPHQDFLWFFSQAPLLNSMAVETCYGDELPTTAEWTPPTSFTNVDALSMVCGPFHQGYTLRLCNQVRDLEIHSLSDNDFWWRVAIVRSSQVWDAWPNSIKSRLRRLRWSSSEPYGQLLEVPNDEGLLIFPHLRDFQSLETLEIDHGSLYLCLMKGGLDPDMPEEEALRQLPTILPKSIQLLKIHYYELLPLSTLVMELDVLTSAKETTLPRLSVVQIDLDLCPETFPFGLPEVHRRLPEVMKVLGVVNAMKNAGIDLRVGFGTYDALRGILAPSIPGNIDLR